MANQAEPGSRGGTAPDSATPAPSWSAPGTSGDSSRADLGSAELSERASGPGAGTQGEVGTYVVAGHNGPYPTYHGRTVSWIAIGIIMAGFLAGGLSLVFGSHGPTWWLFWVGAGVSVLGVLVMLATNTFEDWY